MAWWDYIVRGTEEFARRLEVITESTAEPVTVAEALAHLRVTSTDEAAVVSDLIAAARIYCEGYSGRAFTRRRVRQTLDRFPRAPALDLYASPLLPSSLLSTGESAIAVRYWPAGISSTAVAFGSTNFILGRNAGGEPKITLRRNRQWPTRELRTADAVELDFWVGLGIGTAVPAWARQGILLTLGHWFENREAVMTGTIATVIPMSASAVLGQHRNAAGMI